MSFIDNLVDKLPLPKPAAAKEYFFALNVSPATLTACLWTIDGNDLKILGTATGEYSSSEEIIEVADRLLDQSLGELMVEPEKILFGVPDSWLQDDDLKPSFLKLLQGLVKSLDLKPMAYVATSHALTNFLEKKEGAPTTGILIGIEENFLAVTVARAGKIDGTKVIKRQSSIGEEIEKALLMFTEVEVLPSRMLVYNSSGDAVIDMDKQKANLLAFPWMNKLSLLHFPKVELLDKGIVYSGVALAGASEINPNVKFSGDYGSEVKKPTPGLLEEEPTEIDKDIEGAATGFMVGDVMEKEEESEPTDQIAGESDHEDELPEEEEPINEPSPEPESDSDQNIMPVDEEETYAVSERTSPLARRAPMDIEPEEDFLPAASSRFAWLNQFRGRFRLLILPLIVLLLVLAYVLLPQAKVTIFVEPKVLENDTQVTADPSIKAIDESAKAIPGQVVSVEVNGTDKGNATGNKKIGDPAKGSVVIYNKTDSPKTFSQGTVLTANNLKFTLDSGVSIASESAVEGGITFGKVSADVTASVIGADGNLSSGTNFTIADLPPSQFSASSQGNFSGGTSKDVTVVTDADQKKLLASLASSLRSQAQQKLQATLTDKKVLEDGLSETIVKKSYSKNINDQASDFSLNLTVKYSGIAYSEADLKTIVSKLVSVEVPDGYQLDLANTETQADVSKIENNKLTFLARFKANLVPKIDTKTLKDKIKGKTPTQAEDILKSYNNVLSAEVKINPSIPGPLLRLPFWSRNIQIVVSLK